MSTHNKEFSKHSQRVKDEYENHLIKHDDNSPEAAHWKGKEKTWLRFKILTEIDDLNNKKILDFGCGNGLLVDFLEEKGVDCEYQGWDISQKMIDIAKRRHPEKEFTICNILEKNVSDYNNFFDYVIISGVSYIKVNAKPEIHEAWMKEIILRLWPLCKEGMAANFLTEYVNWKDKSLYYCAIGNITSFCVTNLSKWFLMRHDYQLWELSIYVFKKPRI